jgi:hypothetical protein
VGYLIFHILSLYTCIQCAFLSFIPRQVDDPTGYLHAAADKAIESLQSRMTGFDGQQSHEVAQVIVNVAHLGMEARKVTDVPFSVGTNRKTQALISSVRKNPTGMFVSSSVVMVAFMG